MHDMGTTHRPVISAFNLELYNAMKQLTKQQQPGPFFLHYRAVRPALPVELGVHPEKDLVIDSRAGATIAFKFNEDGTISYVPAWCHPKDNYSKARGRLKARAMLEANSQRVESTDFTDKRDLIAALDSELSDQHGYVRVLSKKHNRKPSSHEQPGS